MKVVTIDFDIIMSPSIEFYNDLVGIEDPLKDFVEEFSFLTNLPADLYQYEYLTRYIIKTIKNVKEVFFISDHKDVIKILQDKIPKDEQIDIINIDHHHDIGYNLDNWKIKTLIHNCGNWVKVAKDKKLINSYTWIKNNNSNPPNQEAYALNYIQKEIFFEDSQLELISKETDYLILCQSFEWIPPVYQPLFLNWITICEEMREKDYFVDNF